MFDVGGGELILIVLAVIVLFGPKKIPEVFQMVAKGMQQFRKAQMEIKEQIEVVKTEVNKNIDEIQSEVKTAVEVAEETPDEPIPPLRKNYKPIPTKLPAENGDEK